MRVTLCFESQVTNKEIGSPVRVEQFVISNLSEPPIEDPRRVDKQRIRIHKLGCVQATIMSARLRIAMLFSGYIIHGEDDLIVTETVERWAELVNDDYFMEE